ncbi:MAG: energy transducer TonB [Ignavibacteria bacterium]|nr:energy transducer TonB [Ignavibacteria bacterium]
MNNHIIEIPPQPTYGFAELKIIIPRNTFRGFIITISFVIVLLLAYLIYAKASESARASLHRAPISKITLGGPIQELEEQEEEVPPPPPTQQILEIATAAKAGTPVPIPDAEIKEDLKEFATFEKLSESLAREKGLEIDISQLPTDFNLDQKVEIKQKEEEPDIDEFIPFEKEPYIDLVDLQKRIVYPEMARKAGIEGQVVIRVLVDKTGKPKRAVVQSSDSEMLNQAAIDAVMKSTFTPAIQNGQPIMCWVSIPIRFKLR